MAGNDVEIRIRVSDQSAGGLRNARRGTDDLASGASDAANKMGLIGTAIAGLSFGNITGATAAVVSLAGAALLLPAAFSAAAAAMATFQIGTSGIMDAITAKAGGGGGGGGGGASQAISNAKALRSAQDAVITSQQNLARAGQAVAAAQRGVAAAQRGVIDAMHSAQVASRNYQDALNAVRIAEVNLTNARAQAKRMLEDMAEAVKDAALGQEGADIALARAQENLIKTQRDVHSTALDLKEAQYQVKVAQDGVTDASETATRAQQDNNDAQKKGVEGSDMVVAAQEQLHSAQEAAADSAYALQQAQQGVADAEQAVADAKEDLANAEINQQNAARAAQEAAQDLADTLKQQQAAAAGAAGGIDAYAEALKKISPKAREFVQAIRSLGPAWRDVQFAIQDNLFNGLAKDVKDLAYVYFPVLKAGLGGIASAFNGIARYSVRQLLDPDVIAAVNKVLANTKAFFDNARTSLGDFLAGFLELAGIGSDFLPAAGKWLADIAREFRNWVEANPDKIRGFISDALTNFGLLFDILGNIGRLFIEVFASGNAAEGKSFLQMVKDVTGFLADHAEVVKGVMYALATMWVVGKVAGFALAVLGVITKVRLLAAEIRRLPPLPGAKPVGKALLGGAVAVGVGAAAYGIAKANQGKFADNPTQKSVGGGELMQQGNAGFVSLADSFGQLFTTGDSGMLVKWWNDQMKILGDQVADIGNSPLGQFVTNLVISWQEGFDAFGEWWGGFWEGLGTAISTWWNDTIVVPLGIALQWINDRWNEFSTWFMGIWENLKSGLSNWWNDTIVVPVGNAVDWIRNKWLQFWDWLNQKRIEIGNGLANMWQGMKDGARTAVNAAIGVLNGLIRGVNMAIQGLNVISPVKFGYVGYIPYLAKGGVASGLALVGENGPELVDLPSGSRVHSANDSARMMAGNQGQQQQGGAIELRVAPGADQAVATMIMQLVRTNKIQLTQVA